MNNKARPSSVTIIAWVLISCGAFTCTAVLLLAPIHEANPYDSICLLLALGLSRALFLAVCGTFMLMGKNLARVLFLCGAPVLYGVDVGIVGFNWVDIVRLAGYVALLGVLTRNHVTRYFREGMP